jgi:hypothetical protein
LLFDRIAGKASFASLGLQLIDGIAVGHHDNRSFLRFFLSAELRGRRVCGKCYSVMYPNWETNFFVFFMCGRIEGEACLSSLSYLLICSIAVAN